MKTDSVDKTNDKAREQVCDIAVPCKYCVTGTTLTSAVVLLDERWTLNGQ